MVRQFRPQSAPTQPLQPQWPASSPTSANAVPRRLGARTGGCPIFAKPSRGSHCHSPTPRGFLCRPHLHLSTIKTHSRCPSHRDCQNCDPINMAANFAVNTADAHANCCGGPVTTPVTSVHDSPCCNPANPELGLHELSMEECGDDGKCDGK